MVFGSVMDSACIEGAPNQPEGGDEDGKGSEGGEVLDVLGQSSVELATLIGVEGAGDDASGFFSGFGFGHIAAEFGSFLFDGGAEGVGLGGELDEEAEEDDAEGEEEEGDGPGS